MGLLKRKWHPILLRRQLEISPTPAVEVVAHGAMAQNFGQRLQISAQSLRSSAESRLQVPPSTEAPRLVTREMVLS